MKFTKHRPMKLRFPETSRKLMFVAFEFTTNGQSTCRKISAQNLQNIENSSNQPKRRKGYKNNPRNRNHFFRNLRLIFSKNGTLVQGTSQPDSCKVFVKRPQIHSESIIFITEDLVVSFQIDKFLETLHL